MSSKLKLTLGLLVFIAGFLIIRIGFVFHGNLQNTSSSANILGSATGAKPENALTRDSDHDGLPDREEIVYGTDPLKADSDGDGYVDGEEVITGHNPLDASDNDKTRPGNFSKLEPNLTDKTANLTAASLIDNTGTLSTANIKNSDVNGIVLGLSTQAAVLLSINPVQDSDIRIVDDNSQATLDNYVASVAPIIKNNVFNPNLLTNMTTSDANLQTAIDSYQQADQELRTMDVPSSWKEVHKDMINTSEQFIKLAQALTTTQIEADPVKALFALKGMQSVLTDLSHVSKTSTDLAKSQNLSPQTLNILLSK